MSLSGADLASRSLYFTSPTKTQVEPLHQEISGFRTFSRSASRYRDLPRASRGNSESLSPRLSCNADTTKSSKILFISSRREEEWTLPYRTSNAVERRISSESPIG